METEKIVQITISPEGETAPMKLFALTNLGRIWKSVDSGWWQEYKMPKTRNTGKNREFIDTDI